MPNRPTPTHLKVVKGTQRKDRSNADEPKPDPTTPIPPAWLSDEAKVQWGRFAVVLEQMGVLTIADGAALERLVLCYLEVKKLEEAVAADGHTYRTKSTQGEEVVKANPAVAMLSSADTRLRQMLIEFGLTPAARTKVHTVKRNGKPPDEKPKPAAGYFAS